MELHGTIAARMVLRVVDFCRRRGHDGEALLAEAGLSRATLEAPDARVHHTIAARVGMAALALTGDESFGLHLAADVGDVTSFDAGTLLLLASPNVRVALERMVANQRYWSDGERASLRSTEGGVIVRFHFPGAEGAYARHADECALAEMVMGLRVMTAQNVSPRLVRFRHAAPRATVEHAALFACPLVFDAPDTELLLDDTVLDTAMPQANAIFFAVFEEHVARALARLPAPCRTSEMVRETVRGALAGGGFSLAETARAIGVSPRTMQRRLQEEGTSFADVVEALRREMATAYLDRGVPVAEVASLLGYADSTAFHHAFRRWTGTSPGKRSAHAGD